MAALAKPPRLNRMSSFGRDLRCDAVWDIRGRRTGRVGEVEGIKETREVENRK